MTIQDVKKIIKRQANYCRKQGENLLTTKDEKGIAVFHQKAMEYFARCNQLSLLDREISKAFYRE